MSEDEMSCLQLRDVAAELALGVLTGRERAAALDHLEHCDACREEVRQLRETGVKLVELLPPAEPPAGFETRVLARLGLPAQAPAADGPPAALFPDLEPGPSPELAKPGAVPDAVRPRVVRAPGQAEPAVGRAPAHHGGRPRRRLPGRVRRTLAAAAVTVAVVGAGLGGWRIGVGSPAAPATAGAQFSSAQLLSSTEQDIGTVYRFSGEHPWLYMSIDMGAGDERVTCQTIGADGQVHTIGTFQLTGGYGGWGSDEKGDGSQLRGARLLSASGTVLATADFSQAS